MGTQQDRYNDAWAGLEPEQPNDRGRWVTWLAGGVAGLVAICLCGVGGYLLAREFLTAATPVAQPAAPTVPSASPLATSPATAVASPPPTPAVFSSPTIGAQPTVTLPGGATATPAAAETDVTARLVTAPPAIDGALTEWDGFPIFESRYLVYQIEDWDGSDDLHARWRLGWDLANLYVAIEVTDDLHVQSQVGNQIFRGDSVDMQFDTDRLGDLGNRLSPDDFQITLSPGDFAGLPPSAFRFQGTTNDRILDAPGGHHVTVAAQKTATGYTLEAAIPWSDLNLAPAAGLVIGIALNASDNDTPGAAVQEVMKSHAPARTLTDPTTWGTLTLE
jgi:hypothetical protein